MSQLTARILIVHAIMALLTACAEVERPAPTVDREAVGRTPASELPSDEAECDWQYEGWLNDGQIAAVLRAVSTTEVDEARAAEPRLVDPDVQLFAATMIADHSATADRTEVVARERSIAFEGSDEEGPLLAASDEAVTKFGQAKASVDRTYIQDRVNSAVTFLEVFEFALAPQVHDATLLEHIELMRDQEKVHVEQARALLERLDRQGGHDTRGDIAAGVLVAGDARR